MDRLQLLISVARIHDGALPVNLLSTFGVDDTQEFRNKCEILNIDTTTSVTSIADVVEELNSVSTGKTALDILRAAHSTGKLTTVMSAFAPFIKVKAVEQLGVNDPSLVSTISSALDALVDTILNTSDDIFKDEEWILSRIYCAVMDSLLLPTAA